MSQEEEERHRSEVREWMKRRAAMAAEQGKQWLRGVLVAIEKRRGKKAAERLTSDIREQWTKGNRGEWGDWR